MVTSVLLSFGVAAPWAALAQSSDIYLCIDEQGNKSYQNVGSGKGCKRMDVGPVAKTIRGWVPVGDIEQLAAQYPPPIV